LEDPILRDLVLATVASRPVVNIVIKGLGHVGIKLRQDSNDRVWVQSFVYTAGDGSSVCATISSSFTRLAALRGHECSSATSHHNRFVANRTR
jgi:hypothetical protein